MLSFNGQDKKKMKKPFKISLMFQVIFELFLSFKVYRYNELFNILHFLICVNDIKCNCDGTTWLHPFPCSILKNEF